MAAMSLWETDRLIIRDWTEEPTTRRTGTERGRGFE
jgi:hypothetical protein